MKFIKVPFFSLAMSFCFLQLNAQTGSVSPAGQSAAKDNSSKAAISSIRSAFNRINALALKQEKFNYEVEGCVEEGVVTYFKSDDTILKVTESGSIGDGSWKTEYYYRSGKVFFCYEMITGGPALGKVTTTERRFYINNDQTIQYMEDKKVTPPDSRGTEIIATAYKLLKAYSTKDFATALCNP